MKGYSQFLLNYLDMYVIFIWESFSRSLTLQHGTAFTRFVVMRLLANASSY